MVNRPKKHADGLYHISGGKYKQVRGTRAQVMHGNAYKTNGGLTKKKLKYNKSGKIVSRRKSARGPKLLAQLRNAGYRIPKKGDGFGVQRMGDKKTRKRKRKRKRRRSRRR